MVVSVSQLGCGNESTAPSLDIDPSLVGTWVAEAIATDESGVELCTYVQTRLVLHDTGRFDWYAYDLVSPSVGDCDETTSTKESGQWRTQDGNVAFTPPPAVTGVEGPTLDLAYELVGDELSIGFLMFDRE